MRKIALLLVARVNGGLNPVTAFTGYEIDTTVIVDVFSSPPVQGDCNSLQSNILSSNITRAVCLL